MGHDHLLHQAPSLQCDHPRSIRYWFDDYAQDGVFASPTERSKHVEYCYSICKGKIKIRLTKEIESIIKSRDGTTIKI